MNDDVSLGAAIDMLVDQVRQMERVPLDIDLESEILAVKFPHKSRDQIAELLRSAMKSAGIST